MNRIDIGSAVEKIVAGVADEHGLVGIGDLVTLKSRLNDDLGMDEIDILAIMCRAEDCFGIMLPDDGILPSSTVGDIAALVTVRLNEKQAGVLRAPIPDLAGAGLVAKTSPGEIDYPVS